MLGFWLCLWGESFEDNDHNGFWFWFFCTVSKSMLNRVFANSFLVTLRKNMLILASSLGFVGLSQTTTG